MYMYKQDRHPHSSHVQYPKSKFSGTPNSVHNATLFIMHIHVSNLCEARPHFFLPEQHAKQNLRPVTNQLFHWGVRLCVSPDIGQ